MTYDYKVIPCRLKTGGKSIKELQERYKGQGFVYRDFENMLKADNQFDGLTLLLSIWDYDSGSYHLHSWSPEDDERIMMGIYYSEQFHPFPRYKDRLEAFRAVWAAGEYDPGCVLTFDQEDVEEIEGVAEEVGG